MIAFSVNQRFSPQAPQLYKLRNNQRIIPESQAYRKIFTKIYCQETQQESQPSPVEASEVKVEAEVANVEEEEEKLGVVGSTIMWGFLIFLFAGSLFFTFGRSFQPDLEPLDPQTIIEMTSM
eukprot:TRINITY_DN40093_c0_g2_i3.p3 TRINITY_DN40093_c0_g2~~TRINITY_DN40093_c0_g2_i3.p3  ORF type:complete len:122 (-),score=13.48 TRINITY_DN40093_c0_g2_i3:796-1161(-)